MCFEVLGHISNKRQMSMERRKQSRTDLHIPLFLLPAGRSEPIQTETENVSLNGFFCYTKHLFAPGEHLKFLLLFPEVASGLQTTKTTYLHGVAEVTRITTNQLELEFGIGCHLTTYRVLSHVDSLKTQDILATFMENAHSHTLVDKVP
jgi:hypothetical protein